jgi:phage protein D
MADISLDTQSYEYSSLESSYEDFFVPAAKILVKGTDILDNGVVVSEIRVDMDVEKSDSFEFTVENAYDLIAGDFNTEWTDNYFKVGTTIEISMGYVDTSKTLIYGIITEVQYDFEDEDNPAITVRGMDMAFLMMRGEGQGNWNKKKYSEVVSEIAGNNGLIANVDDTGKQVESISQGEKTDYLFIKDAAEKHGFEFFIVGKNLYFRKLNKSGNTSPSITLEYGVSLVTFSPVVSIAECVSKVIVNGWDKENRKKLTGQASSIEKLNSDSLSGPEILAANSSGSLLVHREFSAEVATNDEAAALANNILAEKSMSFIRGTGSVIGLPEIRAGRYVKIKGAGQLLSKLYYIRSCSHKIDEEGYMTSFEFGGNSL